MMNITNRNLILVGGGGHCKSVIDIVEQAGWSIHGILDVPENVGNKVVGYQVIGIDDRIGEFVHEASFLVTVGQIKNTALRIRLHNYILSVGGKLATIIAPDACVSRHSEIDVETVGILPMKWNDIIGKTAIRDFEEDELIGL
jgi:hypothetical protein